MKAIRIATICHNEDDVNDPNHRRIMLRLEHDFNGYIWRTSDGEDCSIGPQKTVKDAENAAIAVWGSPYWDLRSTWIKQ